MMLSCSFKDLDLNPSKLGANVLFVPEHYSHAAIGGPVDCEISTFGSTATLWETFKKLGELVWVYNQQRTAVWWGRVVEVAVGQDSLTLEGMANDIRVKYKNLPAGATTPTGELYTTWAEDSDSVARYGRQQSIITTGEMVATAAEQLRDLRLFELAKPLYRKPSVSGVSELTKGRIIAKGLWFTLGLFYYENGATALLETSDQIINIAVFGGDYFNNISITPASGLDTNQYRDGSRTCLEELQATVAGQSASLLELGSSNLLRYLAKVDPYRNLTFYEEPERGVSDLLLKKGDLLTPQGDFIPAHLAPLYVGRWARRLEIAEYSNFGSIQTIPEQQFLEKIAYDATQDAVSMEYKNVPSAWAL
jgi:hypothetical protein